MSETEIIPLATIDERCEICHFWKHVREWNGVCRRYPKMEAKTAHDWCGEFALDTEKYERIDIDKPPQSQ